MELFKETASLSGSCPRHVVQRPDTAGRRWPGEVETGPGPTASALHSETVNIKPVHTALSSVFISEHLCLPPPPSARSLNVFLMAVSKTLLTHTTYMIEFADLQINHMLCCGKREKVYMSILPYDNMHLWCSVRSSGCLGTHAHTGMFPVCDPSSCKAPTTANRKQVL